MLVCFPDVFSRFTISPLFQQSRTSFFWLIRHCEATHFHGPLAHEPAVRLREGLWAQSVWSLSCSVSWTWDCRAISCCLFLHIFPTYLAINVQIYSKMFIEEKFKKLFYDYACLACYEHFILKFETICRWHGHICFVPKGSSYYILKWKFLCLWLTIPWISKKLNS